MVDEVENQRSDFSSKDQHDDQKKKAEADFGLPQRGAATHQTENEHHHADADNDDRWDKGVLVLDETAESVIALDHTSADVGQRRSCRPEYKAEEQQDGFGCDNSAVHVV